MKDQELLYGLTEQIKVRQTLWRWFRTFSTKLLLEILWNSPKIEIATHSMKIEPQRTKGVWSNFAARFSSFNFFKSWMLPLRSSDSSVRNFSPYFADNIRFVLSKAARHSANSFSVLSLNTKLDYILQIAVYFPDLTFSLRSGRIRPEALASVE